VLIHGALYEVWIAATMVWSGFDLRLEDESDRRQTHCEFTATSKRSRKSYSVEAKVCDPGNIGGDRGRDRALRRQLSRALGKQAAHPRIVFIDLNEPRPAEGVDPAEWLKSRARILRRQERALPNAPAAFVFLTNYPYRYHLDSTDVPRQGVLEGFKVPKLKFDAPFTSLRELGDFREEHADLDRLQAALGAMQIPATLDGQPPSRVFGRDAARVLIGEKYELPTEGGRTAVGELTQGIVNEHAKEIIGVFVLEDGTNIICKMPISDDELAAYRESPETFFGIEQPVTKGLKEPIELYEWLLNCCRDMSKETLLESLAGHPDIGRLRDLPRGELAKIYAESCVLLTVAQGNAAKTSGQSPRGGA
jgi:hypothetical protein